MPGPAAAREGNAELGRFIGITQPLLDTLVHPDRMAGPVAEALRAMARDVGGAAFPRQQTAILGRVDSRDQLAGIRVPTLVGVGDSGSLTPLRDAE